MVFDITGKTWWEVPRRGTGWSRGGEDISAASQKKWRQLGELVGHQTLSDDSERRPTRSGKKTETPPVRNSSISSRHKRLPSRQGHVITGGVTWSGGADRRAANRPANRKNSLLFDKQLERLSSAALELQMRGRHLLLFDGRVAQAASNCLRCAI